MSKLLIASKIQKAKKRIPTPSPTAMPAPDWRGSSAEYLRSFCSPERATGKKPLKGHTKQASMQPTKTEVRKWALKITFQQLANGF